AQRHAGWRVRLSGLHPFVGPVSTAPPGINQNCDSSVEPVTKPLFRQMLAEEMLVIQDELGEHRYSSGRFDDAARLMEQITTSDELIDFLTLPGYRLLA
ncbi:hypothetical protein ACSLNF_27275, partial [Citrobacter youngae]